MAEPIIFDRAARGVHGETLPAKLEQFNEIQSVVLQYLLHTTGASFFGPRSLRTG
jgi:hypothetical protein